MVGAAGDTNAAELGSAALGLLVSDIRVPRTPSLELYVLPNGGGLTLRRNQRMMLHFEWS